MIRRRLLISFAFASALIGSYAASQEPPRKLVPGRYLIVVKGDADDAEEISDRIGEATGAAVEPIAIGATVLLMHVHPDDAQATVAAVQAMEGVDSIVQDAITSDDIEPGNAPVVGGPVVDTDQLPNDPRIGDLWFLDEVDAYRGWDHRTSARDLVIAVTDDALHDEHEDLIQNRWINFVENSGVPGIDDDGNGYIDDYIGYDTRNNDNNPRPDWVGGQWQSHGTHVAGTIAARGNNGLGISGLAWDARLMGVRCINGTNSGRVNGIYYAVNAGADVINCSWSNPDPALEAPLRAAVEYADSQGVLVICAAGNDSWDNDVSGNFEWPTSLNEPNQLVVAALDSFAASSLAPYSNWGRNRVHLAAPGSDVWSTVPGNDPGGYTNSYANYDGTSMATPMVTAAAALLWANEPSLTHREVRSILLDTVDRLDDLDDLCTTEGRLNLRRAIGYTLPPTASPIRSVVRECTGESNIVQFTSIVDDPSDDDLQVEWEVVGQLGETAFPVSPGTASTFEYDFPHGTSTVRIRVSDGRKTATQTATVTVQDTTSPVVVVAANVVVPVHRRQLFATDVDLGTPFVEDACDGDPTLVNDAPKRFPLGDTAVTWTATDADGNVSTATQVVTVVNAAPIADAGSRIVRATPYASGVDVRLDGSASADPDKHELTFSWTASGVEFDDPSSATPTGRFAPGTTVAKLTVTDEAGDSSSSQVVVTVRRRNVTEKRVYAPYANWYSEAAYAYGYASYAAEPYESIEQPAYDVAYYSYLYGAYATDRIVWGKKQTRGQALRDYKSLRYSQLLYSGYASDYWQQSYGVTGDLNAYYAYLMSLYAVIYGEADLKY